MVEWLIECAIEWQWQSERARKGRGKRKAERELYLCMMYDVWDGWRGKGLLLSGGVII